MATLASFTVSLGQCKPEPPEVKEAPRSTESKSNPSSRTTALRRPPQVSREKNRNERDRTGAVPANAGIHRRRDGDRASKDGVFLEHQGAARLFLRRVRSSMARRSRWASTCPCISARCRCLSSMPGEAFRFEPAMSSSSTIPFGAAPIFPTSLRFREYFFLGQAAIVLRRQSRASRRRRRDEPRFDAARAGDLPGRHSHSSRSPHTKGEVQSDMWNLILANVRTPVEREGDLLAQLMSLRRGEERLRWIRPIRRRVVLRNMRRLQAYSEKMMRATLRRFLTERILLRIVWMMMAVSEQPVRIAVEIRIKGDEVEVDFTGSDPQAAGPVNANLAIVTAATGYVFRCLLREEVPFTAGLLRPIRLIAASGIGCLGVRCRRRWQRAMSKHHNESQMCCWAL